ncbi:transposable element Tc1 transposase [Trichonephila clavipes]|nr:transposable element Tc1 transposase [Trichonephila clavipes]
MFTSNYQSLKEVILELRANWRITRHMGRSYAAIRKCWEEWVDSGRFQHHDGSGRPRATADQEDRLTVRSAVTALDSSLSTIRLFSDGSHFHLCPDDHRRRVWRRSGQRANPAFTIARHTGPRQGVMVWGAISFEAGPLWSSLEDYLQHIGTSTAFVLLPFLLQYPGSIFQQDNAKPQRTRVATNCLTAYQTLSWPARSPDPSPIEHVWDMMGRRLYLPGNVDGLARQLEQIWPEIPQRTIKVLYHSVSRRVAACIQARGGSTPY